MLNFKPHVTRTDVERVVSQNFSPEVVHRVLSLLETYGAKPWHPDKERTHLACLKLANGDLRELERHISVACTDLRDVVFPAENPNVFKIGFVGMTKLQHSDPSALEALQQQDWDQYRAWFEAAAGRTPSNVAKNILMDGEKGE